MAANAMVAVCDILGFSSLVSSKPPEVVVDDYLQHFRRSLYHSIHKTEYPESAPARTAFEEHPHVGVAWFSDTVLLYSKSDDEESIQGVLTTAAWLLFETIFGIRQTRVRIGVSFGELVIDAANSIFVGRPIVDAYRLQEAQQWAGGALTKSAIDRLPPYAQGRSLDWWLIPYGVPLKTGGVQETLALWWTLGSHHPDARLRWSKDSDEPTADDWKKCPDVCAKLVNTKAFHDDTCRWCVEP